MLNKLRAERGLNTYTLRVHAGESGSVEHLSTAFLLSESVNHGINLRKSPSLEYLYYLGKYFVILFLIFKFKLKFNSSSWNQCFSII